ncbi:MAG: hypothetical protein EBY80_01130 [Actinobacteria bacterium]|nr:hypothetical protein [Actinomycetota bacterium]
MKYGLHLGDIRLNLQAFYLKSFVKLIMPKWKSLLIVLNLKDQGFIPSFLLLLERRSYSGMMKIATTKELTAV